MQEYRCGKCNRLLFKATLLDSRDVVEVLCRCGGINTYTASHDTEKQYEPDGAGGYVLTKAKAEA